MISNSRICAQAARVTRVDHSCREHVRIEFELDEFPSSHAGQFLQIECHDDVDGRPRDIEWHEGAPPKLSSPEMIARSAFLNRPFSIADRYTFADGKPRVQIISRDIGVGTHWLDRRQVGDTVRITGPLGRGFQPAAQGPHLLIGGGVGIPPLLYLARTLYESGVRDVFVIFGCASRDLFPLELTAAPDPDDARPCLAMPADADFPAIIATDDGSLGVHGRVTDALERLSQRHDLTGATAYACGPEPMLHAVARQTRQMRVNCRLCIEKPMGCGVGTCLSCITRVPAVGHPSGLRWALSCTEGPVFDREDLPEFA